MSQFWCVCVFHSVDCKVWQQQEGRTCGIYPSRVKQLVSKGAAQCPAWGVTCSPSGMIASLPFSFTPPPPLGPGGIKGTSSLLNQSVILCIVQYTNIDNMFTAKVFQQNLFFYFFIFFIFFGLVWSDPETFERIHVKMMFVWKAVGGILFRWVLLSLNIYNGGGDLEEMRQVEIS